MLLENESQDPDVTELRGLSRRYFIVQRGRPVFVGRQPIQTLADFVPHFQPVQQLMLREQAAALRLHLQRRARSIDRALQPRKLARIGRGWHKIGMIREIDLASHGPRS
jgi:hypothetical protein